MPTAGTPHARANCFLFILKGVTLRLDPFLAFTIQNKMGPVSSELLKSDFHRFAFSSEPFLIGL